MKEDKYKEGKYLIKGGCVPKREAWQFSMGVFGQNISCALMMSWFFVFCTDVLYMEGVVIGTVLGISRIWDAVNDPLMGSLIDRHRFKNGEKLRPLLRATPIAIGIVVVLLFTDWGFRGPMPQAVYILVLYLLYDMLFTVQDVSMWGMTSIMTDVPKERDKLAQYGRIFAQVGFMVVGLLAIVLDNAGALGTTKKEIFFISAVIFGAGGMALSTLSSKGQERVRTKLLEDQKSIVANVKLLFQNKIVMLVLLGNILNGLSLTVPAAYFFGHSVSATFFGTPIGGLTMMTIYYGASAVGQSLAMFFVPQIAKKVGGMRNILIIANLSTIVSCLLAFMVGFEGNKIWLTVIIFALGSFPGGMTGIARTSLWGDSLDYMEWKTGKRAEAITFAAQTFCDKISGALNTVIGGTLLTLLAYNAKDIEQGLGVSQQFQQWIWPLFILGPVIGASLYLIPLLCIKYPNDLKEQVTRELKERRKAASLD